MNSIHDLNETDVDAAPRTRAWLLVWPPLLGALLLVALIALMSRPTLAQEQPSAILRVSWDPGGTVSVAPRQPVYPLNAVITLTATAQPHWRFSHWQGDVDATQRTQNPLQLVMDGDRSVEAHFAPVTYTLITSLAGAGTGRVEVVPQRSVYAHGEQILLIARPDPGSRFDRWQGAAMGSNPVNNLTATFTITQNHVVTAVFALAQWQLNTATVGEGQIVREPPGPSYVHGAHVTLAAEAASGWQFAEWTGDLSGVEPVQTLTMTRAMSASAHFVRRQYTLRVHTDGNGTVAQTPMQPTYDDGDSVDVQALAEPGWRFVGWSGDLTGATVRATVVITGNRAVTATFVRVYGLTIEQVGQGTVTVEPSAADYLPGTTIVLRADAAPGWIFAGWRGAINRTDCCPTVTISDDVHIQATFMQLHALDVTVTGQGSVDVAPTRDRYVNGETVRLRAYPDPGWYFAGWRGDLISGRPTESFQIEDDSAITARFAQGVYLLQLEIDGRGTVNADPPGPYVYGELAVLAAVPAWGWRFTGWSHADEFGPAEVIAEDNVLVVSVTEATTYVAHFARNRAATYLPAIRR